MTKRLFTSESKFLERARVALTNAETNATIKPLLSDLGIDEAKIAEGNKIYKTAKEVWDLNKREDAESENASTIYKRKYEELQATFKIHRDKASIIFKKQPEKLVMLGIKGRFPLKYNDFFNKTEQFYNEIQNNPETQATLKKIKITPEIVSDCTVKYKELLTERANYEKELGESQDATKSKNAALIELKEWMDDFDTMAKIALYDQPQLQEVLGIFVRS